MSEGKREAGVERQYAPQFFAFPPSLLFGVPCPPPPVLALARLKNAKITAVNSADYIKRDLKSIENETQIHTVKEPK